MSVPLQVRPIGGGSLGVKMKWKAVTLHGAQPIYRLFMEWWHKEKIHVRLLCETNQTSCEFIGKLPFPNRMYVSTVVMKQPHTFQAGSIRSYPTKKVLIPEIEKIPSKPGNEIGIYFLLTISTHCEETGDESRENHQPGDIIQMNKFS